jgi:hypothetical protein
MENPNDRENLPGSDSPKESGSKSYSSDESMNKTSQDAGNDKDPSTWPSGDKSLEDLLKEEGNSSDARIEGDNTNAGKGSTIGNP